MRKREASSGASSLENSGHLPPSREMSCETRDTPTEIQSPSQSRRAPVVDLQNYQEGSAISSVAPSIDHRKRDPAADLEKRVKDELFAEWEGSPNQGHNQQAESDMTASTRNISSPPGVRGHRQLPTVQDLSSKSVHSVYQYSSKLRAEGSPMSPPPPSTDVNRSPVPRSPTIPTATFTLQTSPSPPAQPQPIWGSHSLPHHVQPPQQQQQLHKVSTAQHIHHSDSNEWTDFTSAPYSVGQESSATLSATVAGPSPSRGYPEGFPASYSTPALSALTTCGGGAGAGGAGVQPQPRTGTDVSEFDPIAVSSASGGGVSNETHHKHRT